QRVRASRGRLSGYQRVGYKRSRRPRHRVHAADCVLDRLYTKNPSDPVAAEGGRSLTETFCAVWDYRGETMKRLWQTCVVVVLSGVAATAQSTTTRSVYAIRGAKIYPVSGEAISNGTIVIRNSLIATVDANGQIPPEATVIEGMGLVVYPGLIDSFTDAGLPV